MAVALLAMAITAIPATASSPAASIGCASPSLDGPTDVRVGEAYTMTGCGFAPGAMVGLEIAAADGCCLALQVAADDAGRISYHDVASGSGAYRVRASLRVRNRVRVIAQWSFTAW
jgi:hypothetical protein